MNKLQLAEAALVEAEDINTRHGIFCLCGIGQRLWNGGFFNEFDLETYIKLIKAYKRKHVEYFEPPMNYHTGSVFWWPYGDNESRIKFLKLIIYNEENSI